MPCQTFVPRFEQAAMTKREYGKNWCRLFKRLLCSTKIKSSLHHDREKSRPYKPIQTTSCQDAFGTSSAVVSLWLADMDGVSVFSLATELKSSALPTTYHNLSSWFFLIYPMLLMVQLMVQYDAKMQHFWPLWFLTGNTQQLFATKCLKFWTTKAVRALQVKWQHLGAAKSERTNEWKPPVRNNLYSLHHSSRIKT